MKQGGIILVISDSPEETANARKQLRAALHQVGTMPTWQECLEGDERLPKRFRALPGPFLVAHGKYISVENSGEMAEELQGIFKAAARWSWLRKPVAATSVIPGILMAFFPKCAVCWAAYFSVFNSMGIGLPYMPWLQDVLAATLVISAVYFARMAKRRKRWLPFIFQMAGFAAVLMAQYLLAADSLLWVGVVLVFVGSLLYAMPDTWMGKLEQYLRIKRKTPLFNN